MPTYTRFALHEFVDLDTAPFDPRLYSRLKFGSDVAARQMGHQLAGACFRAHADTLLAHEVVVFASPYHVLPNAATVLTQHVIARLNELLVFAQGKHVEYSLVHRKVGYTADYGFLSAEQRRGLIAADTFSLNRDFIRGKLLLFVDDVRITGTHEHKMIDVLAREQLENDAMFVYFANYGGAQPDIEGRLNFAAIASLDDFIALTKEPRYHVIIRPIKYILSRELAVLNDVLPRLADDVIFAMVDGSLAEGYYAVPAYQAAFSRLIAEKRRRAPPES
jgi:hypothetical protein